MNDALLVCARAAAVALALPLLAWLFGWSVLGRFTRLDDEERFAACWGVSFAFLALHQFLAFVLHADQFLFGLGSVVLMLLAAGICWRRDDQKRSPAFWPLVGLATLAYLHLLCLQALLPDYRGSTWYFDWWMHYDETLIFAGIKDVHTTWAGQYTLASRTPLFNLLAAAVMALAGHDFAVFQVIAVLAGGTVILALSLVVRDLFGSRAARLSLLLAPLNLWLLHEIWFTWPKMLAAYFVLLALHFYLQAQRQEDPQRVSRLLLASGLSALVGFLTHQVALIYFVPLMLHALIRAVQQRTYGPLLRALAVLLLLALPVAELWYGWLAATFGLQTILGTTPITQGDTSAVFRPLHILQWVSLNLAASVFPALLLGFWLYVPFSWTIVYRGLTMLYFSLLTGALTVSLTVYLVGNFCRRPAHWLSIVWATWRGLSPDVRREEWRAVWLFLILGTLGAAVLHPGKMLHGIAHSACFPSAVLLVGLAWGALSRASRRWAMIVGTGMVLEFLLMFWSHWWLLIHHPEVLEDLPGNAAYKDASIVFLYDQLGSWVAVAVAVAVLLQLTLCFLLARHLRGQPTAVVAESAKDTSPTR